LTDRLKAGGKLAESAVLSKKNSAISIFFADGPVFGYFIAFSRSCFSRIALRGYFL
jgi:hypothetical protein